MITPIAASTIFGSSSKKDGTEPITIAMPNIIITKITVATSDIAMDLRYSFIEAYGEKTFEKGTRSPFDIALAIPIRAKTIGKTKKNSIASSMSV